MTEFSGRTLPIWRSMLFVPVTVERFVAGAARRGADAIILDLEDSIPVAEKERARGMIAAATKTVSAAGADVIVRVNRPWRMLVRDLEVAVSPGVTALMLPKIESADHLRLIAETVDEIEAERGMAPGHTRLIAMLETPGSIFQAEAIARAHPRLVALTVGSEDLALAVGMVPEADGLLFPKQQAIFAARAAGILPLGFLGTVADFADLGRFRATIERSRRLGFSGASVIHPGQVAILNEAFRPQSAELDHARRLVAAYEEATKAGRGAVAFEGRMIDVPVVRRAQALIERHEAIEARGSADRTAPVATANADTGT
ncbi:CoA ester lyase [Acidiphilium sp. AL]|uniref:HpcH/HpaI aldolase/citrate lyase family protein n=1 Tax=Acidiphilium sp. AL TaxID=2871704 RepID=UPI0021CB2675|nr:CoA ester lyase [Acidiphilium sp. AL]MCU4159736.1 CoA ester lyase [Acidiphilium sp. AL]